MTQAEAQTQTETKLYTFALVYRMVSRKLGSPVRII